jgi:hypothetical protein
MRKTDFLNQLESAVCATADQELARVGRTAKGCPYIERWIRYYRTRTSEHIQKALIRYAPEAARATLAGDYIPIVTERIRRAVTVWATTGQITGVPEELAGQISGGGLLGAAARLASGIVGAVGGALGSIGRAIGGIFTKTRDGAPRQEADAERVLGRLGSGQALDSNAKARMERAMGHDFSSVRVHTDSRAAELSSELNARAFTVGSEVAFAAGEYQPGTLIGDALLAHELAHVVQQSAAHTTVAAQSSESVGYDALEEDADRSATKATLSLWGGTKRAFPDAAGKSSRSMRSGLRLSRCKKETGLGTSAVPVPKPSATAVSTCSPEGVTLDQLISLAREVGLQIPAGRVPTLLGITAAPVPGWKFRTNFKDGKCRVVLDEEPRLSLTHFAHISPGKYRTVDTAPDADRIGFNKPQLGKGCAGTQLPTYVNITQRASDKAMRAEIEHCKDYKLAFALSYEKYFNALNGIPESLATDEKECTDKILQSLVTTVGIHPKTWTGVGTCLWRRTRERDTPPRKWHSWELAGSTRVEKDENGQCQSIVLTPDDESNLNEVDKHPSTEVVGNCGEK